MLFIHQPARRHHSVPSSSSLAWAAWQADGRRNRLLCGRRRHAGGGGIALFLFRIFHDGRMNYEVQNVYLLTLTADTKKHEISCFAKKQRQQEVIK